MSRTTLALVVLLLVGVAAVPTGVAAAQGADQVDECQNAENGPGADGGPPSFVADLVPDFLSDLIGSLPVPNFVKELFGASTC